MDLCNKIDLAPVNESRRKFLRVGGMVGAAAVISGSIGTIAFGHQQEEGSVRLGSGMGFRIPKRVQTDPLYQIDMEMFQKTINFVYGFWLNGVKLTDTTLMAVKDLTPAGVTGGTAAPKQSFSLIFTGPTDIPLAQGTYQVFGGGFPVFQLFIVPGMTAGSEQHYEALINRLYP